MDSVKPFSPDAIVRVRLFSSEQGGRQTSIPNIAYRCPVFFSEQREQANDCVFFFSQVGLSPEPGGANVDVPVMFLCPELVASLLHPGARFTLWEGRGIGEGEILEVIKKETVQSGGHS